MNTTEPQTDTAHRPRRRRVMAMSAVIAALALAGVWLSVHDWKHNSVTTSNGAIDVPLGVEEAVIIRYAGPPLVPRPYRRGASVSLRIAREQQQDGVRVYDVRYVVNLPGEFDLTQYLASLDGSEIDDLPSFKVRGVTRLTKDIDTRIREIEEVDIDIWHWYYETLVGAGILWVAWLVGLVLIGRSNRQAKPEQIAPRPPSVEERISGYLQRLESGDLTVEEKAELEVLMLTHWRRRLNDHSRLAEVCQRLESDPELGRAYVALQQWLHAPRSATGPDEFVEQCRPLSARATEALP